MKKILLILCLTLLAPACINMTPRGEGKKDTSENDRPYATVLFHYADGCTEPPVLQYTGSHRHHGGRISDSNIDEIYIWKDGTVAWSVFKEETYGTLWYQATVPAEKVETAVEEIIADYKNYPSPHRQRHQLLVYMIDANYSPSIDVQTAEHYELRCMDYSWWEFYKENREVLQSGDEAAILKTIKEGEDNSPLVTIRDGVTVRSLSADTFSYTSLVDCYRANLGKVEPRLGKEAERDISDEELLLCVAMFKADAEHILLVEKKMLDLLPSTEGLEAKELETKSYYFRVDVEKDDEKPEFIYTPLTEKK